MSLKLLVFINLQLVMILSHPFSVRSPVLNFCISQKITVFREVMQEMSEKLLIPTSYFTCFLTLVEHMLRHRVLAVPGAYPEHLPTLELEL